MFCFQTLFSECGCSRQFCLMEPVAASHVSRQRPMHSGKPAPGYQWLILKCLFHDMPEPHFERETESFQRDFQMAQQLTEALVGTDMCLFDMSSQFYLHSSLNFNRFLFLCTIFSYRPFICHWSLQMTIFSGTDIVLIRSLLTRLCDSFIPRSELLLHSLIATQMHFFFS